MKNFIFSLIFAIIYICSFIDCLNYVSINSELIEKINNNKEEETLHSIEINQIKSEREELNKKELEISCLIITKNYLRSNKTENFKNKLKTESNPDIVFDNFVKIIFGNCLKSALLTNEFTNQIIKDEIQFSSNNYNNDLVNDILGINKIDLSKEILLPDNYKAIGIIEKLKILSDVKIIGINPNTCLSSLIYKILVGCSIGLIILIPIYLLKNRAVDKIKTTKQNKKKKKKKN